MAGGNMGDLWFSLDIKSKIDAQLKEYSGKIKDFQKEINNCRDAINVMSADLGKMAKGSDAWNKQREAIASTFRLVGDLINKTRAYEEALGRVQNISRRVDMGGLLGPSRTFTTKLDTKPLEEQITKYERIIQLQKDIANYQQRIVEVRSRTIDKVGGFGVENFNETTLRLKGNLASAVAELNKIGGANITIEQAKAQLSGLYSILGQFDAANKRAASSTRSSREEEQRRAKAIKDARIAFEPLVAAQAREEAQERANRANIEATNQARQRSVQVLRQQAEAMMQNHIAALQSQKTSLGRLYTQGKAMGLDSSELQTILSRYREIAQELLNMRTLMQNPGGLGYSSMFEMGRFPGAGANYVREAREQVNGLRQQTQEAAAAARNLATAFDRVHNAAQKSSSVLSDIKSLFLQGGLVFGAQQFARSIIQTGGDIVQQHIALRSILGDIQKADELFAQTQQLALQSPFTFQQLNKDVKQLAAFGVDTDRLYDTTKRLADVASGLGVSFERLGLAYGQVKARSWLDGKELRQFAYAGLPMLQKIADLYNDIGKNGRRDYTTSDVRTMITKRQVSFEDVDKVFQRLTDKGGQFYNMQFVLSDTLLGRWNKLEDAWTIMLGKFADGGSVIGRVFSTAINGATELVLSLDRISPLLLSFGAIFGGGRILGAISASMGIGTSNLVKQMSLAQQSQMRSYATAQMQKVAEGEITAEIARQNILKQRQLLASTGVRDMTYAQIFAEGKISALQLAQLARRGEVSAALITQLRTMGLITAKQEQLILQAKEEGVIRSRNAMMQLGGSSVMSKLGSFFTPGNIAMIGASVGLALWMGYNQWSSRIEQSAKAAAEHAKQQAKEFSSAISSAEASGATKSAVERMKEIVEQSDLYTGTMQKQVEHASTLQGKYDALLQSMKEMQKVSESIQRYSPNAEDAIKATSIGSGFDKGATWKNVLYYGSLPGVFDLLGRGWEFLFNDDMEKNLEQYASSRTQYDNSVDAMSEYAGQIHNILEGIKGDYAETYKAIQGKPFEQQLRILSQSDAWDEIIDRMSESDRSFRGLAKTYIKNTDDVDGKWTELVTDDVPKLMSELAYQNNMSLEDYKDYCKKHPQYTAAMIRAVVGSLNSGSKEVKNQLVDVLLRFFGLASDEAKRIKGEATQTEYQKQTRIGKQVMSAVVNKYGNGVVTTAQINTVAGPDDGWSKVQKNIQQKYSEASDNYTAAQGNKYVTSGERAALLNEREMWRKVAEANGMSVTSKSDKAAAKAERERERAEREREKAEREREAAARKADNDDEKRLKARLQLIKDAYATYEKYYKLLHDEQAAAKEVSEQYKDRGLSNDDVAKITSRGGYRELIEGYLRMARGMNYRRPSEMRERKDEDIATGVRELNELDINTLTEQLDEFASTVNRDLDEMGRKWELYQQVLKAQGDPELAARISGLAGDSNARDYTIYNDGTYGTGYARRMSDYMRTYLDSLVLSSANPDRAIDYDSLMKMSDKEIEQYAGNLFASTDASKVKGFIDAFKQLKKLVTDTEFKEGVEAFDDLLSKIVTEAAQQTRNNQRYNDTINKLEPLRSTDPEGYRRARAVVDANHAYENLQAEDAYKQFMGQVTSMTEDAAENMRNKILAKLYDAFESGALSADDYMNQIKEVNQQMDEFKGQHSNAYSFFTGGLNGLVDNIQRKNDDKARALIEQDKRNGGGQFAISDGKGNFELTKAGKALFGKGAGAAKTVATVDAIVNGINDNVQSYKKLEGTWTDAFGNGLANSKFSNFMGGFTEASQGAADAWNSLKQGDIVGTFEGGIRSFTGWFSWGNAAANKRWQEQAEYLKGFQKTLSEINSTLKNKVSSVYGSMSATYANELQRNLGSEAAEVRKTYFDWSQAHTITRNHRNRMYTNLDYDQINAYLRTIGYTGSAVGGDTIQNLSGDYLEKIRERFAGQWSKLPDEAQEYLNRLIEIESETGEITEATKALSEALTGLNVETLQSEYADLLDQLDSANEDFADNLEKHLRNAILSTMIANLYKGRIEELVDYTTKMADTKSGRYVSRSGTIKTHTGGDDSADVMSEYTADEYESIRQKEEALATDLRNSRDYLRDLYGWSEGSSSMTSSIQGMTEQTGDLLAAYLNAIRGDVSVLRQMDSVYWPKIDITTQAQLQQLNMITENTLRNAEAAERIDVAVTDLRDMLSRAQSNTKPIYVRAQ